LFAKSEVHFEDSSLRLHHVFGRWRPRSPQRRCSPWRRRCVFWRGRLHVFSEQPSSQPAGRGFCWGGEPSKACHSVRMRDVPAGGVFFSYPASLYLSRMRTQIILNPLLRRSLSPPSHSTMHLCRCSCSVKARSPRGQSGLKMHSNSYDPDAAGSGSDSEEASLLPLSGSTGSASLRVLGFEVSYSVNFARRKLAITTTFNPVARRHAPASGARLAT
jgi:hypothetical protein